LPGVIQIRRARRIDGRLVLYVEHYLNPGYFPGILDYDLTRSLTELYAKRYGMHYDFSCVWRCQSSRGFSIDVGRRRSIST